MDPRTGFVAAGGRRWTSDSQSSMQRSVRRERTGARIAVVDQRHDRPSTATVFTTVYVAGAADLAKF